MVTGESQPTGRRQTESSQLKIKSSSLHSPPSADPSQLLHKDLGDREAVTLGRQRGHLLRHRQRRWFPSGFGGDAELKSFLPDADVLEASAGGEPWLRALRRGVGGGGLLFFVCLFVLLELWAIFAWNALSCTSGNLLCAVTCVPRAHKHTLTHTHTHTMSLLNGSQAEGILS